MKANGSEKKKEIYPIGFTIQSDRLLNRSVGSAKQVYRSFTLATVTYPSLIKMQYIVTDQ